MNEQMLSYYNGCPGKEWKRLESLWVEFAVNMASVRRHVRPGSRILDIGAGPGRYSLALAKEGHEVWIADPSVNLVSEAREQVKAAGVEERVLGCDVMDARDLGRFADGTFDAVLALGPFYHLQDAVDRERAAREIARVLRPGGTAFLAFIPRTYVLARSFSEPGYFKSLASAEARLGFWKTGCYDSDEPGRWTGAFCGKVSEMCALFEGAGLKRRQLLSSEGVTTFMGMEELAAMNEVTGKERERLDALLLEAAAEPEMVGLSFHALFVGEKEG